MFPGKRRQSVTETLFIQTHPFSVSSQGSGGTVRSGAASRDFREGKAAGEGSAEPPASSSTRTETMSMGRIGPGAYGNTGVPYLDMIPRAAPTDMGARNGAPVIPGGRLITYHDIVSAIVGAGICPDNNVFVRNNGGRIFQIHGMAFASVSAAYSRSVKRGIFPQPPSCIA